MASDLHLALHEGDLGVQLAQADLFEVSISHSESSVGIGRLSLLAQTLSVLQVNLVDQRRLGTFLGRDLEAENSIDLRNEGLAVASIEVSRHHVEDTLGLKA